VDYLGLLSTFSCSGCCRRSAWISAASLQAT